MLTITSKNIKGAGLIEYGILVGLVAIVSTGAILALGDEVKGNTEYTTAELAEAVIYAAGAESVGGGAVSGGEVDLGAPCYDAANIGAIGEAGWSGCEGMLIVDENMLRQAASDDTFTIAGPDANDYTFGDSAYNVFTGQVISLQQMFYNKSFNQPIGYWDTSNLTSLRDTFSSSSFNQDLSNWDTSNVEDMMGTFAETPFNQDIGGWDTSSAHTLGAMFAYAGAFDQDIGAWTIHPLATMEGMFDNATAFNQDLSNWCVPNLATKPGWFDNGAYSWTADRPVWGTCPDS